MNNKYELVKFKDEEFELGINIAIEERTAWLNIKQIALLFNRTRSAISKSIKTIITNKTFEIDSVSEKISHTGDDGKTYEVKVYNLDIILEVGSRVKSNRGLLLKQFVEEYINSSIGIISDVIIYDNNGVNLTVNVSPKKDTVYLTIDQMAILFDRDRTVVYKHIKNTFNEGELDEKATCIFCNLLILISQSLPIA